MLLSWIRMKKQNNKRGLKIKPLLLFSILKLSGNQVLGHFFLKKYDLKNIPL